MKSIAPLQPLLERYQSTLGQIPRGEWSPFRRFAFRALALFLILGEPTLVREVFTLGNFMPLPSSAPPSLDSLTLWFGEHVFGLDLSGANPRLSDSKPYAWVNNATYLTLSLVLAGFWCAFDRRRRAHPVLQDGLWTILRMIVALHMFTYGFAKVFGLQFTIPTATVLMSEVGSLTPADLMKVFMGTSQPYSAMAGWAEVIGGALLCFRRTTLLGALLTLVVMTNVFALNVFYDFGVQRLSLELTLMILLIMAPYLRNLIALIALNRAGEPVDLYGPWTHLKWRRAGTALMTLWCVTNLLSKAHGVYDFAYNYGDLGPRGALDGTWSVTEMSLNGTPVPAEVGSAQRWRSLTLVQRPKWTEATLGRLDSSNESYRFVVEGDQLLLKEMSWEEDLSGVKLVSALTYRRAGDSALVIEGELDGARLQATLKFMPQSDFKLLNGQIGLVRK